MTSDVPSLGDLSIKVFADGADLTSMAALARDPMIAGVTTNPTLMRKAGITDYAAFAQAVLEIIPEMPVSFEVFADDFAGMVDQAREISSWGRNVYVKIPVTTTFGQFCGEVISELSRDGVQLNVTALMSSGQVERVVEALEGVAPAIVSVFAGRLADTGRDPVPVMQQALTVTRQRPATELLWASPREVLNLFQAAAIGCDIVTVTHDLLAKLDSVGKDPEAFSLETVQMFHRDAEAAAYTLAAFAGTTR